MKNKVEKVHHITISKVDPVRSSKSIKVDPSVKTRYNKGHEVDHENWQQHSHKVIPE
jgi:hypothetical protein